MAKESRFSVKKSLSHSDERFHRQPFCAVLQKLLLVKNFTDERGGSIKIFRRNVFLSHSAENFLRWESLSVSLVSSIETILDKSGEWSIKIFCRVFFVSPCRKLC